ncbi:MAG: hypothetical protein IJL12_01270 [Selenomonadaceae bacterium]|nr:hypothetical protein [Selenomonadaceae bacterium]
MTIEQFAERYYLHDSSLEKVDFDVDKKILALTIEFCFWMQNWYDKSEPSNGLIRATFKDVSIFEYDDCIAEKIFSNIDSEIRYGKIDTDGNFILFAVEAADYAEQDDIYFLLKISAASVDVEELERYNL